jgi:hypothetical protein
MKILLAMYAYGGGRDGGRPIANNVRVVWRVDCFFFFFLLVFEMNRGVPTAGNSDRLKANIPQSKFSALERIVGSINTRRWTGGGQTPLRSVFSRPAFKAFSQKRYFGHKVQAGTILTSMITTKLLTSMIT